MLLGLLALGQQHRVDVGQHTAAGDGDVAEQLVQLLVVADGELHVARDDAGTLVVAGGVAGELEDLSAEVLEDGGEVDTGADTDTGGVAALLQVATATSDGELKSGLAGGANGLSGSTASLSLSLSFSC